MGCKIGSCARKAKSGFPWKSAGRGGIALLAGVALLGLAAIWFLGGPGRSTGSNAGELVPQLVSGPETSSGDGLAPAPGAGRANSPASESSSLAPDDRSPQEDPRFTGPAGELRGHVEVTGDVPFPTSWTLVLRPSNTLFGRELAEERRVEFDDGRQDFTVTGLPLAGYDVEARAEKMNGVVLPVLIDKHTRSPFVNLRMLPAGFLAGLVRDAEGLPADGFPITLLDSAQGDTTEAVTDTLGRFRFDGILDGAYQLILGDPASPVVAERRPLRFQAPSMILPDIELPPLGHLTLKVVDEQRRLLPDTTIKGSGNQGGLVQGTTDGYGLFETRYLPAGRYRLRLELDGFASKRITLELGVGESKEMTLQMLRDS